MSANVQCVSLCVGKACHCAHFPEKHRSEPRLKRVLNACGSGRIGGNATTVFDCPSGHMNGNWYCWLTIASGGQEQSLKARSLPGDAYVLCGHQRVKLTIYNFQTILTHVPSTRIDMCD